MPGADAVTSAEQEVRKLRDLYGAGTDAPSGAVEGATSRSVISLLKSIANYLYTLAGGLSGSTVKYAFANVAQSQTDSSIVAAVVGKKIRVRQFIAIAGGTATNLTFNSKGSSAGAAISPLFANGANGGEVLPFSPAGWFETVAAEALTVTTGAGSTTGILVGYVEV